MSGSTPADVLTLTTDPADAEALIGDHTRLVLDHFAGPGGWSTGIADLLKAEDLLEVALEWDAAACLTRVANGHTGTLRADVAAYPVVPFLGRTVLYIGSPPCQTFSMAGNGTGRAHLELLCWAVRAILLGHTTYEDALARLADAGALDDDGGNPDPRNGLILIPARTIRALLDHDGQGPTDLEAVALEQVPPAGLVFDAYAVALRELGFSAVSVTLNAADYGVAQTRERRFVLASRVRVVGVPVPTHAKGGEPETIFGPGRLPWVSMARALGWGMVARPYVTVAGGRPDAGGPDPQAVGGTGGRKTIATEVEAGRFVARAAGRDNDARRDPATDPAPTVRGNADNIRLTEEAGRFLLDRRQTGAPVVDVGVAPCPTITGAAVGKGVWAPVVGDGIDELLEARAITGQRKDESAARDAARATPQVRDLSEPSYTLRGNASGSAPGGVRWVAADRVAGNPDVGAGGAWAEDRPATVVASREIVQHPGATKNRFNDSEKTRNDGLRITEAEGGILQGFPADYAWEGPSKGKRWEQIGNVVCPPVARRVIGVLLGVDPDPLPWHAYAFEDVTAGGRG